MRGKLYSFENTFGAGTRNVDAVTSVVIRGGYEIPTINTVGVPGATVAGCFMYNDLGAGGVLRVCGCSRRYHSIGLPQKVLD